MFTREIPRHEWTPFFDGFSTLHEGWIVIVEVLGAEIGDQEEAIRLPLAGVTAEVKGGVARIEIIVGNRADGHAVLRIIETPEHVWFKQPEISGDEAIEIEDENGLKTLVTFARVPIGQWDRQLPEV
jgi:Family of unknown function (DUF5335)